MCMCVHSCFSICAPCRGRKRTSNPPELELHKVTRLLIWVLEIKPDVVLEINQGSVQEQASVINHEATSTAPKSFS